MSAELLRKIRKARLFEVKVGKFTFTVRRPTDVEALALHREDSTFDKIASAFVTDWAGVVEDDLVGGGGQTPAAFDRDLWIEWCADRTDFWIPISSKVLEHYSTHAKKAEDAGKVLGPG